MPDLRPLTPIQQRVLDFLRQYIADHGYGPSLRDAAEHFQFDSVNGVTCHLKALERKGYITRTRGRARSIRLTEPKPVLRQGLPLLGQVAAGTPVEAVELQEWINFDRLLDRTDHFVLEVGSDSMLDAQIKSGDLVVIRRGATALNGQIVAILAEDEPAVTLRKFYRETDHVRLEPTNPAFETIRCPDVALVGVVVGLVRRY